MRLRCVAAKFCSKAIRAGDPPRSPPPWAAACRPSATPSGRSPGGAWTACNPGPDPQDHPHRLAQAAQPRPTCLAAPVPAPPGQANQPVDVAPGRSGLLRKGLDTAPAQRRDHPPGPQTSGRRLEARKHWLTSPDPEYAQKKTPRSNARKGGLPTGLGVGLPGRALVTRLAQPDLFAWAGEQPLRLSPNEHGGGDKALACYGLLCRHGGDAAAFRRGPAGQSGD